MKNPKVSFILGIYNAERTLKECIDSIYMQDFPEKDYEIIIGDGGSTDSTLQIVKDFQKNHKNITLFHNPGKLSEGKGMSKDTAVKKAKGDIVVFLDHDNIIMEKDWLRHIIHPFKDKKIMASQSQLSFKEDDTLFLKYINALGVEDPFATPVSLVSQITLNPDKFRIVFGKYYTHTLANNHVLFIGANGCAFRKLVFKKIGGYTRDVDVSASMAEHKMQVAVPIQGRIHHKTSNDMLTFLKKKCLYFYRFINNEYKAKKFRWVPESFNGKLRFAIQVALNLTLIVPSLVATNQIIRSRRLFWILHPFFLFYITLLYGFITLFKIKNFISYARL